MTDDAQRARRRAHNAHALARCNAMGRTAGSILWQPLQTKDGKWFMPDGAELSEVPIEWRSERLDTILDEMDAIQAVAPVADPGKAYVETLDVEKWKAETEAQFDDGAARLDIITAEPPLHGWVLARTTEPSTISLEELQADVKDAVAICMDKLEKAIMTDHAPMPVKGYTTQSDARVAAVNTNKEFEERVLRILDDLGHAEDVDKRWLAIGRTHIEQGFMAVNRAIFQPQRAKLPGDAA